MNFCTANIQDSNPGNTENTASATAVSGTSASSVVNDSAAATRVQRSSWKRRATRQARRANCETTTGGCQRIYKEKGPRGALVLVTPWRLLREVALVRLFHLAERPGAAGLG